MLGELQTAVIEKNIYHQIALRHYIDDAHTKTPKERLFRVAFSLKGP